MREYTHINLNRNNRKFLVVKIEKENLILDENFLSHFAGEHPAAIQKASQQVDMKSYFLLLIVSLIATLISMR